MHSLGCVIDFPFFSKELKDAICNVWDIFLMVALIPILLR